MAFCTLTTLSIFILYNFHYIVTAYTVTDIEIGVLSVSTSIFQVQLKLDNNLYSCNIYPNTTIASCQGDLLSYHNDSTMTNNTMTITHIGLDTWTTFAISSITLTIEHDLKGNITHIWDSFCSCLDDAVATQYDHLCVNGLNKWTGVCMSGVKASTCGIYSWPTLTLELNLEETEAVVDTSTPAYYKHECDQGYVDITGGNTEYWACGEHCPGGEYLTDGVCTCACIADQCNTEIVGYDGFAQWWIILLVVIFVCCFLHHRAKAKQQRGRREEAVAVQVAMTESTVRRAVIGDGGTVMCHNSHPLVFTSKTALLDTSPGYRTGFICDKCRVHNKTDGSYHCRACKFDLCHDCYGSLQSSSNTVHTIASSSPVKCPQAHPLIYTTAAGLVHTNSAYSNGFICNNCRVSFKDTASYHCAHCSYDLCTSCYTAANSSLQSGPGNTSGADPPGTMGVVVSSNIGTAPDLYTASAPNEEQAPPPAYEPEPLPTYEDMGGAPPAYEDYGNEGAGPVTNY